jgi:hypothetical protein
MKCLHRYWLGFVEVSAADAEDTSGEVFLQLVMGILKLKQSEAALLKTQNYQDRQHNASVIKDE